MTTGPHRESAKIYQFPPRARAAAGGRRGGAEPAPDLASPHVPKVAFEDGWYHEAAIQEAKQATLKR